MSDGEWGILKIEFDGLVLKGYVSLFEIKVLPLRDLPLPQASSASLYIPKKNMVHPRYTQASGGAPFISVISLYS